MKIIVLEDHLAISQALVDLINAFCPVPTQIHTFYTLSALQKHGVSGDLLISDLSLPDSEASNTANFLLGQLGTIRIVCHSSKFDVGEQLAQASNGQIEYVKKGVEHDRLRDIICNLSEGESFSAS
jgi:DNA-binding NarL/FixJ family response regulator